MKDLYFSQINKYGFRNVFLRSIEGTHGVTLKLVGMISTDKNQQPATPEEFQAKLDAIIKRFNPEVV